MSVIIDKYADTEVFSALKELNIRFYKSCNLDFLYSPVNTHPDMQIHFINSTCAVAAPSAYEHYRSILPRSVTLHKGNADPGRTYPWDCAYNVANLAKKVIGNLLYTDSKIKELYAKLDYEFINVKQGYTKCNLCIIDKNSVITEDAGLAKTLQKYDIEVLKLSSYETKLKGFKNGFIGGASGCISPGKIAFLGNLSYYTDKIIIEKFIKQRGVDIIYLSSTEPEDFGSVLYIDDSL